MFDTIEIRRLGAAILATAFKTMNKIVNTLALRHIHENVTIERAPAEHHVAVALGGAVVRLIDRGADLILGRRARGEKEQRRQQERSECTHEAECNR